MEEQFDYWKLPSTRVSGPKFLASTINDWAKDYVVGSVTGIPAYALGNAVTHLEFMKNGSIQVKKNIFFSWKMIMI